MNVRSQVSTSPPLRVIVFGVPIDAVVLTALAVGTSLDEVTVSDAVAGAESPVPSLTL